MNWLAYRARIKEIGLEKMRLRAAASYVSPVAHNREYVSDKMVLLVISGGLIAILLSIVIGLLRAKAELPNWAENVFVSIATASALKLGDCLSTLVALTSGRQVGTLATQLGKSQPVDGGAPPPQDAVDAAGQVAGAANDKAGEIQEAASETPS